MIRKHPERGRLVRRAGARLHRWRIVDAHAPMCPELSFAAGCHSAGRDLDYGDGRLNGRHRPTIPFVIQPPRAGVPGRRGVSSFDTGIGSSRDSRSHPARGNQGQLMPGRTHPSR